MRRAIGALLVGLGVFGIALAVILPTIVVPASKKTPLDLNITQVSSGPAKLLNAQTGQLDNVRLQATRTVRTDSAASDGSLTTVDESLCIVIVSGKTPACVKGAQLLSVSTDRVTADRKSAESVHKAAYLENVNGNTKVRHTGLSYKWPIDAKKQTYQFYQPDLLKAFPATYEGTSKVAGLTVYKYVCATGDQPYKVQGVLAGTYNDTRTVYVEPKTGAIVNGVEHQVQKLASGQVALDTTLSFEPSAINYQSKYAKDKISQLRLAQLWAPIVLAVLGLVALVGGVLLLRRRAAPPSNGGLHRDNGSTPGDGSPPDPNYGPPADYAGSSQT